MSRRACFLICCLALVSAGCASFIEAVRFHRQELSLPPQLLVHPGFAFLPPDEQGWYLRERTFDQLGLAKAGASPDATYAVQIWLLAWPVFSSDDEMLQHIREGMRQDTDPVRFTILEEQYRMMDGKHGRCARSYTKAMDTTPAKHTKLPGPMTLESIGYSCRHPNDVRVIVHAVYSHRHYPDDVDPNLATKGAQLFERIEFSEF